jgi:hypothetical protein
MARRLAVVLALLALGLNGCSTAHGKTTAGSPAPTAVTQTATPTASPTRDLVERRARLQRQLRRVMAVRFLDDGAETLRGASTIDGITLDEVLAGRAGFDLAPDDDIYTGWVTSLVAGRHQADGSFDPMFDDLHVWLVRRHHFMEGAGCDKLDSPESCQPCAWFYDLVDFFVPALDRNANPYGSTLRPETVTGTEAEEAAAGGMKPCR